VERAEVVSRDRQPEEDAAGEDCVCHGFFSFFGSASAVVQSSRALAAVP
jgi:hypothetical protein